MREIEASVPSSLLVGVAQPWPGPPRALLFELLAGLDALGRRADAVFLRDGSERARFQHVARVRLMKDLSSWSLPALVERGAGLAGRRGAAERAHQVRLWNRNGWLGDGRIVHLNGPQAVTLLRYLPSAPRLVTTYVHPADLAVDELPPADRDLLLASTTRFLAASAPVVERLVAAGVEAHRITRWERPVLVPPRPTGAVDAAPVRERLGMPSDAAVVAVPAVPGWVDSPDLTVALAWELQRRQPDPPVHVYWYGGPYDRRRRWPIEHELATIGLTNLHLDTGEIRSAIPVLPSADLAVLPTRDAGLAGTVEHAARWGAPLLCWANHPDAAMVQAWGGTVVPFPDVSAMADCLLALLSDGAARERAALVIRQRAAAESAITLRLLGLDEAEAAPEALPVPVPAPQGAAAGAASGRGAAR